MASIKLHAIAVITLLSLSAAYHTACGELIIDPEPQMTWQELVDCELVVVGKYESHENGVLTLGVERVLKGDVKRGDSLDVQLQHWWSVETGPVGFWARVKDAKGDGKPRICYKQQYDNPGPLVPHPIVEPDESAIFFFPKNQAVLRRSGQVKRPQLADGWQRAVRGEKLDLAFRLGQSADTKLAEDAFAELKSTRAPKILDLLIEDLIENARPNGQRDSRFQQRNVAYRAWGILIRLGDQNGDVYDRVLARMNPALESPEYAAYRLAYVLGAVDPGRALVQFREWIETEPPDSRLRKVATSELDSMFSEGAMELAISLLPDKEVGDLALHSIWLMISNQRVALRVREPREKHRALWDIANQRLSGTSPPEHLSEEKRETYRQLVLHELGDEGRQRYFREKDRK